MLKAFGRHIA
ncbi:ydaB, partial [Escherichia coli FDA506]